MTKRAALATAVISAGLLLAPGAEAKLVASFSERDVAPGDRVTVDLGQEAERFLSSLRVYLVPIDEAGTTKGQSDPHQRKVAEFLGRTAGDVPATFDFAVPHLPPGLYASEIWFRGIRTEWFELSGIQPRLAIGEAAHGGLFGLVDAARAVAAAVDRLFVGP
jgi:hypothetical protein